MRTSNLIVWITGCLTLAVAGFAFASSYKALFDLAEKNHYSIPAFLPLTLEAGVIIFSLNVLVRSLNNEDTKLHWSFIIFSSVMACIFNMVHVGDKGAVAIFLAATPSVFLVLSFESFLAIVKRGVMQQEKAIKKIERKKVPAVKKEKKLGKVDLRRMKVAELKSEGKTQQQIAGALGYEVRTIQRDLKAMNGKSSL